MSDRDDDEEFARLERLNEQLTKSLQTCRNMLHDYQARLAANSNDALTTGDADEQREA